MCDTVLSGKLTCGHSAIATCQKCLGEFCNNHLISHECFEILEISSTKRNKDPMIDAAGREIAVTSDPLIEVTPTLTPSPLDAPEDIYAKAYQLLGDIKSSGCAGIVIILGGAVEVQIIGHGLDNSNAADTLREIARAVDTGGVVTEVAFDLRPSASN